MKDIRSLVFLCWYWSTYETWKNLSEK